MVEILAHTIHAIFSNVYIVTMIPIYVYIYNISFCTMLLYSAYLNNNVFI